MRTPTKPSSTQKSFTLFAEWPHLPKSLVLLLAFLGISFNKVTAQFCNADLTNGIAAANVVATGTSPAGQEKEKAFDNLLSTKWYINSSTGSLQVDLGTAKMITYYSITSANDIPNRDPRNWVIEGSNNGSTYTTLQTVTNAADPFSSRYQTLYFNFANTTAYRYYRFRVTANSGDGSLQIAEMQFLTNNNCVVGNVYNTTAPAGYPNIPVVVRTTAGTVASTTTNAAGAFSFDVTQIPTVPSSFAAGTNPHTTFSVIVQPPAGTYFDLGPVVNLNTAAMSAIAIARMPQQIWPNGAFMNNYGNTTAPSGYKYLVDNNLGIGTPASLDWTLKPATAFVPPSCGLIASTLDGNGTFANLGNLGSTDFVTQHAWQPSFHSTVLNPTGSDVHPILFKPFSAATTAYTNSNTTAVTPTNFYNAPLIPERAYNMTSFLGTQNDGIVVESASGNNASYNLLNGYEGGWRKTYGHTTGDVYDQFLAVNGDKNGGSPLVQFSADVLSPGTYYFNFFGKNANSFVQNINTTVELVLKIYSGTSITGVPVSTTNLTLPQVTSAADDLPTSPWSPSSTSFTASSAGTYTFVLDVLSTSQFGNDFYLDDVTLSGCSLFNIAGNVFNDIDALNDGQVDNNGGAQAAATLPAGLTANLFNSTTGAFVATVNVQPDGSYLFPSAVQNTNYVVILSNVAATAASTATTFTPTLPSGWVNTGDVNPTDPIATAATPGISAVIEVALSSTINVNFGIQRLPESAFNLQPATGNPGGFNSLTVPTGAFQTNNVGATPNTQDYDGGTVTNIRITEFPTGANSITIGTTTYTNGGTCPPATTCTAWPAAGVTVPYTNSTGPSVPIKVDPVEGNIDVVIKFASIDNAGKEDPTPGSVTIPFKTISVTGTVWDDTNGDLTQNGTEAVINGTNTGGGVLPGQVLYANLIDANGIVIATVPVQSNGTYSFPNVPQSATGLTVQLSTNQGTVGLAKPTTTPPAGWVTIGENKNGQGGVADAGANGEISLTTGTTSITQQNFAIERVPDSDPKTQFVPYPTGRIIPAGKATTDVTGRDPEEGTYTSGTNHSIVITTLPTNAIMLYNGSPVLVNQVITGFNPLFLSFTNISIGSTQVEFQYAFKDLAQQQDPTPAKYILTWANTAPLPITLESFTAKAPTCDKIDFDWKISNAINFKHFEIEKSGNGTAFHSIAVILYNPAVTNYQFSETIGSKGQYQYRLKMVDEDGTVKYSTVAFVRLDCNQQQIMLFPNPVKNNLIITGLNKNEKISLYAINGSLLYSKVATSYQEQIEMTRLSSGVYKVIISNSEGTIIKSSTIIKADQ